MKNELIHALSAIKPHLSDKAFITRLIRAVESRREIPSTDYEKVSKLLFRLLDECPEIMKSEPNDKQLKDLGLFILQQIALLELKGQGPHF